MIVARCLAVAWRNLMQHKLRTATAAAGITFAIFLLFIQIGFLQAIRTEATLLYDYFDFDLAMLSSDYQFLYAPPAFDRVRLTQALALPEVNESFSLNVRSGHWLDTASERRSSLLLIGVDNKSEFFANQSLRDQLPLLRDRNRVLLDAFSHRDYGSREIGAEGEINGRAVTVAGLFRLGLFFYAEGSAVVDNSYFPLFNHGNARTTTIGLLRLTPGVDARAVAASLNQRLPDDVRVVTKQALIAQEQSYFVAIKPLGIIFNAGVLIALTIGMVILFQVLSTEIGNRLGEYATFKAMGFSGAFVYGIGIFQTLLFVVLAFLPAVLLSHFIFGEIYRVSHLPTTVNFPLVAIIAALVTAMSVAAALVTLGRVRRADPAELF